MKAKHILAAVLIIGAMAALIAVSLRLTSDSPPTIHFVGVDPKGTDLIFEIRNPGSTTWSFFGLPTGEPFYRLVTASEDSMPSVRKISPTSALEFIPIPPKSTVPFHVERPADGSPWINVQVDFHPSPYKSQMWSFYNIYIARWFRLAPITTSERKESGIVNLPK